MKVEAWSSPPNKRCQLYVRTKIFCLTACLAPLDNLFRPMTTGHWCTAGSAPVAAPPTCFGSWSALSRLLPRRHRLGGGKVGDVPAATQGLDQQHGGAHPPAADLDRSRLV